MSKKVEALWDCPYCNFKEIGGLTKKCPNCGHPQDKDTVFYLKGEKKYLDEEKSSEYGQGADWICIYCGSLNRFNTDTCVNCGAPKADSEGDYFSNKDTVTSEEDTEQLGYQEGENYGNAVDENPAEEVKDATESSDKDKKVQANFKKKDSDYQKKVKEEARKKEIEEQKIARKEKTKKLSLYLAGAAAILIAIFAFLFIPRKSNAELTNKNWNRSIAIEEYKTVQESDWTVPDGGKVTDEKKEIHHYDTVLDHYETVQVEKTREVIDGYDTYTEYVDNGDGTYSEETRQEPRYVTETYYETEEQPVYVEVPKYQTKYYYDIDKWVVTRYAESEGDGDEPYWADSNLTSSEREGEKTEEYSLTFTDSKGKTYTVDVSQDYWNTFSVGDTAELTTSGSTLKKINGEAIK